MNKIAMCFIVALLATFASAKQYSKLSIVSYAKERGCWTNLKNWIQSADLWDEWDCCSYLSDDYPQYAIITNAIISAGVCSSDDFNYILSNSVDTAVADSLIKRIYDTDVKTSSGRTRWHGKVVSTVVDDTNTLTKVTTYEDGTKFVDLVKKSTLANRVIENNKRLPKPVMTNGIPSRLVNARLKFQQNNNTVSNVTVTLKAGQ
jgi:hypothetical protein